MDQPQIKPETNRSQDHESKKGGFLANFLSKMGGSSAAGAPGVGGLFSGGLLATKTGVIALALIGTTVAGGIGIIGFQMMGNSGGGPAMPRDQFNSVFESRPQEGQTLDAQAEGEAKAPENSGTSSSLQYLAQANGGSAAEEKKPEAAGNAGAAASAAPASGASPAAYKTAMPAGPSASPKAAAGGVKLSKLSSGLGGGGGGTSSSMSGGAANAVASARASGAAGGFSRGAPGRASGASQRGIASLRQSRAGRQLMGVRKNHIGAVGSAAAGLTYDGGAGAQGSTIGGEGGSTIGGASGDAAEGAKDTASPLNPANEGQNEPSEPIFGRDVTPWANALKQAQIAMMTGFAFLMLAGALADSQNPYARAFAAVCAAAAAAAGLAAVFLGGQITKISGGPLAGLAFVAGGALIAGGAIAVLVSGSAGTKAISKGVSKVVMKLAMISTLALGIAKIGEGGIKPVHCDSPEECHEQENKGGFKI